MDYYTYHLDRECRKCCDPIADQVHALRKFCPREVLDDGTIKSCKDDYHTPLRKLEKAPFKDLSLHHEKMRNNLRILLHRHGETVDLEIINQYGIILNRPAEFGWLKDGSQIYYFIEYAVNKINNNQYKIIKHARIF